MEHNTENEIILQNRSNITISGATKIISLKPDLIQLSTTLGDLQISGNNLELSKLDNVNMRADINGEINPLRYLEAKTKQSLFRKIFK